MPRFAVMTFMFKSWWKKGRISHEDLVAGLAKLGVEGIEPFHRDFLEEPDLIPLYQRLLADHGMKAPVVDIICNLVYSNEKEKRQGREELRRGLEVCRALGTEIAHVAGHRLLPDITPGDGRKMIADGLLEAADEARDAGMVLAFEDFNPSPDLICSGAQCREILDLSNGVVKFVFDTGNFIAAGERADEVFDLLADDICHCHFKDFSSDPAAPNGYRSVDVGTGEIPNADIAARLMARGYDQWIALETRPRDDLDPVTAIASEWPLFASWFKHQAVAY